MPDHRFEAGIGKMRRAVERRNQSRQLKTQQRSEAKVEATKATQIVTGESEKVQLSVNMVESIDEQLTAK